MALADAGARVTIVGRRREPLEAIAAAGTRACVWLVADVTDEAAIVGRLRGSARQRRGPISIVVANAGAAESAPFARTSLEASSG